MEDDLAEDLAGPGVVERGPRATKYVGADVDPVQPVREQVHDPQELLVPYPRYTHRTAREGEPKSTQLWRTVCAAITLGKARTEVALLALVQDTEYHGDLQVDLMIAGEPWPGLGGGSTTKQSKCER